jgi:prophage antirepressor-like protein
MMSVSTAFNFGDDRLRVYGTRDEPWFCGKDVCTILEYKDTKKALDDNVDNEYITILGNILNGDCEPPLKGNMKNLKLINEQGLYCLIFNSKMNMAKQFRKWVFEKVLPSIRKNGAYIASDITPQQVEIFRQQLEEKNKLLEEAARRENRLHDINAELLTYKKLSERNESIYIVSTYQLVQQGLFKIGRTKSIKSRNSSHNTTHPTGDKIKILHEFKVNDSALVESIIHKKLSGLRPDKKSEFFMCPYDLLYEICDMIINHDDVENNTVDKIIDAVYKIKQHEFRFVDWAANIDMGIFREEMKLIEESTDDSGELTTIEHATFDMSSATVDQKYSFIRDCIFSYQKNILIPQQMTTIVWTAFQSHLIEKLKISKKTFKALEWRDTFKNVAIEEKIEYSLVKRK